MTLFLIGILIGVTLVSALWFALSQKKKERHISEAKRVYQNEALKMMQENKEEVLSTPEDDLANEINKRVEGRGEKVNTNPFTYK